MTMDPQATPRDLDTRLAELRSAAEAALPPRATDRAIADAVAAAPSMRANARRRDRWIAWPIALAASIAVLSIIVRSLPPEAVLAEPAATLSATAGDEFMPVVPLADIEHAGETMVVSARLPRMTLAQLGLPVNPARVADAVDTELLVRRDGSVLAVRFIY